MASFSQICAIRSNTTKRTLRNRVPMSAFGGKADISRTFLNVCFDPKRTWRQRGRPALSCLIDPFIQIAKYSRGRAPDVSAAERHGVKTDGKPVPVSTLTFMVLRRHQESERHFKGIVNLPLIEPNCKARPHTSEHRQDAMAEGVM